MVTRRRSQRSRWQTRATRWTHRVVQCTQMTAVTSLLHSTPPPKLTASETIDVQWRCFLSPEFGWTFWRKVYIIQLLRTKCLPVLYYGLEACPVTKAQTKSLDYALHSCFRKIFSTRDQVVVNHCMTFFDFSSVSEAVKCKQHRFFQRYLMLTNALCVLFCDKATAVI